MLSSNINYFDVVDVFADGFVEKSGWGNNFGTSFATPRVTAELVNLFDEYLTPIIEDPIMFLQILISLLLINKSLI